MHSFSSSMLTDSTLSLYSPLSLYYESSYQQSSSTSRSTAEADDSYVMQVVEGDSRIGISHYFDNPVPTPILPEPCLRTATAPGLRQRLRRNKLPNTASHPRPATDVPLYLPVDRWDLCWKCGYPGHLRGNCTVSTPPRIFCSRCGLYGTMSRHCPCRPSNPATVGTNPSKVSRGVQCFLYPPYHRLKSRTTGTQWEAQD